MTTKDHYLLVKENARVQGIDGPLQWQVKICRFVLYFIV